MTKALSIVVDHGPRKEKARLSVKFLFFFRQDPIFLGLFSVERNDQKVSTVTTRSGRNQVSSN